MFCHSLLRKAGHSVRDFLFPPVCFSCQAELMGGGGFFCEKCFNALNRIIPPLCGHCGIPFSSGSLGMGDCATCQNCPPLWRHARAVFVYDEASRRLVLPLKYADRVVNHIPLAVLMGQVGETLINEADFLIPVPLHRTKLRQRRYNQAALLAQYLGRRYNAPVLLDGLRRLRYTRPLASLTVPERWAELHNAMVVPPDHVVRLRGKGVLLIDDILTTGATAEVCTQELLGAGCKYVDILVAARACLDEDPAF